jgi:hypothetical protein
MDERSELPMVDRHACGGQGLGVLGALVAQRVEATRQHQGRGKPREVVGKQRRDARIGVVDRSASEIVRAEPVHVLLGEEEPVGE